MSKIEKYWLSSELQTLFTGMESDILSIEAGLTGVQRDVAGLTGAVKTLEAGLTGAKSDIRGLTGAVSTLQIQEAGLTGAVNTLTYRLNNLLAYQVGFSGIGNGVTGPSVQDAILQLLNYVNNSITGLAMTGGITGGVGATGLQGSAGATGARGITGFQGTTGPVGWTGVGGPGPVGPRGLTGAEGIQGSQGLTGLEGATGRPGEGLTGLVGATGILGLQGVTGPYAVGSMSVTELYGVTGVSPTGPIGMTYTPVTGMYLTLNLPRAANVQTYYNVLARDITAGSHNLSYMLQVGSYTGANASVYVSNDKVFTQDNLMTALLPAGTSTVQLYWKQDDSTKQTQVVSSYLSATILEGALGATGPVGNSGTIGATGPVGLTGPAGGPVGPAGETGAAGLTGPVGPGVASFDKFVKILPLESWKSTNVDPDIFGVAPVLKYDSGLNERIETDISVPYEWTRIGDLKVNVGLVVGSGVTTGQQMIYKLSWIGYNAGDNLATLGTPFSQTISTTLSAPQVNDFHVYQYSIPAVDLSGKSYLYLKIEKVTGTPNVLYVGVALTEIELPVIVGAGSTGLVGLTGSQGETGYGTEGSTGLPGPTGIPGLTGLVGETGVQGIAGPTGPFGGPVGETGLEGPTGPGGQGPQGDTGAMGETGLQGGVGPTGAFGGPPGETGLGGATGLIGETGTVGYTGAQGLTGTDGITGPIGDTGTQGATGLVGETGQTGVTGISGLTGASGETGLVGLTGAEGHTGAIGVGLTGFMGDTGVEGPAGSTGAEGQTGAIGLQGIPGDAGSTGLIGPQGLIGATGVDGVSELPVYNPLSRYEAVSTSGEEVWIVSSSAVYSKLVWTRSGSALTIYRTGHGHTNGNRVIIRGANMDYQVATINVSSLNDFTVTTSPTGGMSGSGAAYSLGFTFAHIGGPKTGGQMTAPTGDHADVQLHSIRIRTGARSGTTYDLAVPASAVNGAGGDTSLADCYVPVISARTDSDNLTSVAATMQTNVSGSYASFRLGNLGTGSLSRIITATF